MDDEMMEEEFSNHDKEPLLFAWKDWGKPQNPAKQFQLSNHRPWSVTEINV
jgi:hypothetical protein